MSIGRCTLLNVCMSYRRIICAYIKRRPTHLKSESYYSCKFYGKCLYASSKHTSFISLCFAWRTMLTKISSLMPYRRYFLRDKISFLLLYHIYFTVLLAKSLDLRVRREVHVNMFSSYASAYIFSDIGLTIDSNFST